MEKIRKLRNRDRRATLIAPINVWKGTMMTLIWNSLRNAGLIMDLTKGGVHWAADIATMILILTSTLQVVALVLAKDDPERLFECFSVLSFCGMGVIKLYSLRRDGQEWRVLLNETTKLEVDQISEEQNPGTAEYESDDEDNFSVTSYIGRYTRSFNLTHKYLTRIYNFTAIVFIISPFVEFCLYKYQGQDFVGYPHILPMWTPIDEICIFGYLLTVLLEAVSSIYCVCVHVAFDLSTVGLMMFVHGQFSLLHAKSERIGGSGKSCFLSKVRDERAHLRIKNCHRLHLVITDLIKQLNKLTRNILGIYFFVASITLCSVAVQLKSINNLLETLFETDFNLCLLLIFNEENHLLEISLDGCLLFHFKAMYPNDILSYLIISLSYFEFYCSVYYIAVNNFNLSNTQLISLLQYMGATITQLFLFCKYGDAVLNESAVSMDRGPQSAGWWCISPRVRRELLLLMVGMSRRYQLYAGPFFSLDLPTFIQIIRAAYSYYAVLRQKSS